MFWSSLVPVVAVGVVFHDFLSRILVPREPCDRRLLVKSVVFPTDFTPDAQGGAAISVTGGGAV